MFAPLVAGLLLARVAHAADNIRGAVVFSLHGDRTPYLSPGTSVLTPLGAQQLYSSGSAFRARYIASPAENSALNISGGSPILGISTFNIDNSQVYAAAKDSYHTINSAQAFLQGLYPPVGLLTSTLIPPSEYALANGSRIDYPLDGYQYCPIHTFRHTDPNIIWLAGDKNCQEYLGSEYEFLDSSEFATLQNSTFAFYQGIEGKALHGIPSNVLVGYYNAYELYDYVNYGYVHNPSIRKNISEDEIAQLRALAGQREFDRNGNKSASGFIEGDMIRTIAGRTLAAKVAGLLQGHIDSKGVIGKLSLLFGDLEPFMAFFALSDLPDLGSNFKELPEFGSTMVFELFSVDDQNSTYPSESDLWVRFLFRNGTSDDQGFVEYPLFGQGRSSADMKWTEFRDQIAEIMVPKVPDWCDICGPGTPFCPFYTDIQSQSSGNSISHRRVTPPVAGVIGAVVTLAIVGIVMAAMFLSGIRFNRSSNKRRSELGGFKGGQKLASDADLTSGKAPAGAAVSKGHERVGSWELGESKAEEHGFGSLRRPPRSLTPHDDDLNMNPFSEPVKIDDRV